MSCGVESNVIMKCMPVVPRRSSPSALQSLILFFGLAVFTVDNLWAFPTFLPMSQHWLNPKLASARSLCDVKHFLK